MFGFKDRTKLEETIKAQQAEIDRLTAIVKEWQLDGTKPFTVHNCKLAQPMHITLGSKAFVDFRISEYGQETVIGKTEVPDVPTGIYDRATAFVFTDAFGMREGFGGAIGKSGP